MLLQTQTGSENFPHASAKVHVFAVPTTQFPGTEIHIGIAAKNSMYHITPHGQGQMVPAAAGRIEQYGSISTRTWNVPEGMVLKVFAQRKSSEWTRQTLMGNLLIAMREGAALRRVLIALTGWEHAAYQRLTIEGRFDILSVTDAVRLGVRIPEAYERYFTEAYTRRVFQFETVAPEASQRPTAEVRAVENSAGQVVEVVVPHRRRNLDL
jgi:hypothetical protein